MRAPIKGLFPLIAALLFAGGAYAANPYSRTVELFRNAGDSAHFFRTSYGYAVFPTIGKGGSASAPHTARAASTRGADSSAPYR